MTGRLVFLATTHRVAPGLLRWPAWRLLRDAEVLAGSADHPQAPYLAEAGVRVEVVPRPAGELARLLLERARSATVVWLAAADGDEELMRRLGELVTAGGDEVPDIEVLHGSYDLPGARLLDLVATMDELRRHCPWDRKQTHRSLAPHLLEEAYEAVEAVETGDLASLREELGDVLLQVVFHARVAEDRDDEDRFGVDDVAAGIVDKLVRRHPHVFGDVEVDGAEDVKRNWEDIKAAEREHGLSSASVTQGIPVAQPALSLAAQLQRRAERAGVPEDLIDPTAAAAGREAEARAAPPPGDDDFGSLLFSLVARAHARGVDPETALRGAARAFRERLRAVEAGARADGVELTSLSPEEWRERWVAAGA